MIHITFSDNGLRAGLMALLCAIVLSGCGGGAGDYSHRAEERGGEAWQTVETMLVAICDAKSVGAAVEAFGAEGLSPESHKGMESVLGQIRSAKSATLAKLDHFGRTTRATVELVVAKSRTPKPPAILTLLLSADESGAFRIVSVN